MDQSVVGPGVPLSDVQWARIEPLLPDRAPKRGGRWRDNREVIDAIAFKSQTGTQWVHLPEKYGNWRGVYNRLRTWALDGTWERVFTVLMTQADARRGPDLGRVGGLNNRASTPARRRGPQKGAPAGEPADHAIGRSRGGQSTRIHPAADNCCRPLVFVLTAGQAGDAPAFTDVMARLRVPRRRGRPRTRPDVVLVRAHLPARKGRFTPPGRPPRSPRPGTRPPRSERRCGTSAPPGTSTPRWSTRRRAATRASARQRAVPEPRTPPPSRH